MYYKKSIIIFKFISVSYAKLSSQNSKIFANSESEIRFFGWILLALWIATVLYMTRDFFFPSIFSNEIISSKSQNNFLKKIHSKTENEEEDTVASNTIVRYRFSDSTSINNEQVFL